MKKLSLSALAMASILVLGTVACNSATSPDPLGRMKEKPEGLNLAVSISQGPTSRTFRIGVENGGPGDATLNFSCGQFCDVEIKDGSGKLVWLWSQDKYFTQALWSLELAPNETFDQSVVWDLTGNDGGRLSPGIYVARFFITSYPRDEGLVYQTTIMI